MLTATRMKMAVLWDAAVLSLVDIDRRIRGAYSLHLQGKTSVNIYKATRCNIQKTIFSTLTISVAASLIIVPQRVITVHLLWRRLQVKDFPFSNQSTRYKRLLMSHRNLFGGVWVGIPVSNLCILKTQRPLQLRNEQEIRNID